MSNVNRKHWMICNEKGYPTGLWVDRGGSSSPLSERYKTKTEAYETLALYRTQENEVMRKLKVFRIEMHEEQE